MAHPIRFLNNESNSTFEFPEIYNSNSIPIHVKYTRSIAEAKEIRSCLN